jgi:hypothetical protein
VNGSTGNHPLLLFSTYSITRHQAKQSNISQGD